MVGFDIERHEYGSEKYPGFLVIEDVLTLDGARLKDAALIVASPPCQAYSYRAMPWKRAKALPPPDNSLFEACFRIQREASAAAGHHIPLVIENVRGAQPWVGRARWNFGSFYLWGDVPALMPMTLKRITKTQDTLKQGRNGRTSSTPHLTNQAEHIKNDGGSWFAVSHNKVPHSRGDGIKGGIYDLGEKGFNVAAVERYGDMLPAVHHYRRTADDKRQHIGAKRKFASAMIAKIPIVLSRHIARTYYPVNGN